MFFRVNMHWFYIERQKGIKITNVFETILNKSNCKSSKIWVDKGCKFYGGSIWSWLLDNDTEICSTHNEENSLKDLLEP